MAERWQIQNQPASRVAGRQRHNFSITTDKRPYAGLKTFQLRLVRWLWLCSVELACCISYFGNL
jgi:hypothetical protein